MFGEGADELEEMEEIIEEGKQVRAGGKYGRSVEGIGEHRTVLHVRIVAFEELRVQAFNLLLYHSFYNRMYFRRCFLLIEGLNAQFLQEMEVFPHFWDRKQHLNDLDCVFWGKAGCRTFTLLQIQFFEEVSLRVVEEILKIPIAAAVKVDVEVWERFLRLWVKMVD